VTTAVPNSDEPAASDAGQHKATSVLRTLVLCDLVDSTALIERMGDQRAAELFRKHDRLARSLLQKHGGQEIDKTDGFLLMFERPIQAVAFALAYQHDIAALNVSESTQLATRFGIHVGDVVIWDNAADDIRRGAKPVEVEGLVKPIAARLMQLAMPGQILLSGTAYDIAHRAQGELGELLAKVAWRTHGRYRFKGVPDLVPVFEVGEQGLAPLKPPPWSGKAHREMPVWRRPMGIGFELGVLALLIALPIYYLTRPSPAIAFANRDWVVVGDLKNLTGAKVFDDSLQAAFRIGLEQSRYVNVVPELQVRDSIKRMERDPATTHVDRSTGSEVAQREGARALILPTVAEIGGRVRITAEVIDPRTQTSVYSDSVDGAGEDSVLPSMDSLLKKMRERLGESLASIGETSAPLAQATTRNLDALKAYSLGVHAAKDGKGEAIALFNQAIASDPDFAAAYLGLASIQYSIGQKAKAHENVLKATRDLNRLSARERLHAQGFAAWFQTPDAMREKWSLFARLYPDDMAGAQNLGLVLWQYENELAQAATQFRVVTASQHPARGFAWMFLGDIQLAQNDSANARKSYLKARQVGSPQLYLDPVNFFIATGDLKGADDAISTEETRHFPFFEVEKQLRTAAVNVGRGALTSARSNAESAARIAETGGLESSRQRARLAVVAIQCAQGDATATAALKSYIGDEEKWLETSLTSYDFSSVAHLTTASLLALRHGDHALAEKTLSLVKAKVAGSGYVSLEQPYAAAACEARIEQDAAVAVACLEAIPDDRPYFQTKVALLRAYRAAGKGADALRTAQWLVAHRGLATTEVIAEFANQVPNLLATDAALVEAAELQTAAGNSVESAKLLDQFTHAWTSAEGDPPIAQRVNHLKTTLLGTH